MEKDIKQIEKEVKALLKKHRNLPLYKLAKDNCSEMSRLVGDSFLQKNRKSKVFILKGRNVMGENGKCHDILAIQKNSLFYVIDPTIWQFFKYKRNILRKKEKSIDDALKFAKATYKGTWQVSEEMKKRSASDRKEWKKIIDLNMK